MTEQNKVPDVIQRRYDETIASIVNTLQWVIIALILAFIVRCFLIEAFRIPTGSMAETLSGDQYHILCDMCGYKYDLGTDHQEPPVPMCPNCGYVIPKETNLKPANGDRIFVQKCIYQFSEPKRWDVVVFRYPKYPYDNYIKRLIALPGESLEIIDGDIFINGEIQRKPEHVQSELWMKIYDSDFVPYVYHSENKDDSSDFSWHVPFINAADSQWDTSQAFTYSLADDTAINYLNFDSNDGERFRAYYAYNNTTRWRTPPVCGDFKIEYDVSFPPNTSYQVGAVIEKHSRRFHAIVRNNGSMVISEETADGQFTELSVLRPAIAPAENFTLEFALLDNMLIFKAAGNTISYDFGLSPVAMGPSDADSLPQVSIIGRGKLKLSHISVSRDTHYVSSSSIRARKDNPFVLADDEFFMCGDNSMDSWDSRMWSGPGVGNYYHDDSGKRLAKQYRPGIVPREYLVGKAFFLYWGNAFEPFENMLPVVPNFTEMKRIYGGSDKQ